jgi:hypothetical protein
MPLPSGWTVIDSSSGRKGSWTISRVAIRVLDNGEVESQTVLQLLAQEKFPAGWDTTLQQPYWKDKNHLNETEENVELMTFAGLSTKNTHRPSSLGIPSGTMAYHQAYREKNREKFRLANKRYQEKLRLAYKEKTKIADAQTHHPSASVGADASTAPHARQPDTSLLQEQLEKILQSVGEAQEGEGK